MHNLVRETLPLLQSQVRTWQAQAGDLTNPSFGICDYLDVRGAVDPRLMRAAHEHVEQEAEALRLVCVETDGGHGQYVSEAAAELEYLDLSTEADPHAAALAWMRRDAERPVDPQRLCSAALLQTSHDRFLLYRHVHHAVLDGWSLAMVWERTAEIYTALAQGRSPAEGTFPPFRRLLEGEAEYRSSRRLEADRDYWLARAAARPPMVSLAGSAPQKPVTARRYRKVMAGAAVDDVRKAAERLGGSWSDVALTATAAYFGRMGDVPEVVLGVPSPARLRPADRRVPGMTTNGLPLRIRVDPTASVAELVRHVSGEARRAMLHSRFPTVELLRELAARGDHEPLWGPVVNVMMFDYRLDFDGMPATVHTASVPLTKDLSVYFNQISSDGAMEMLVDAHPGLYGDAECAAHAERLLSFLGTLADAEPGTPLSELPLVGDAERTRLLELGTGPHQPLPAQTVHGMFEEWAARTPHAPAFESDSDALSFRQADERANGIARLLQDAGTGPGDRVVLTLRRSTDRHVAALAVLKTGAAFVPVDPEYPAERVAFMTADASPSAAVVDITTADSVDAAVTTRIVLGSPETDRALAASPPAERPVVAPGSPAYVIYTSGSTGEPKGVVVPHRGVVNLTAAMVDRMGSGPGTRTLQFASPSFDAFVGEMTQSVLNGGTLVLGGAERPSPGPDLVRLVTERRINDVVLTPSALAVMDAGQWPADTTVSAVGEACPPSLVRRWAAVARLFNGYGPTEATISTAMSEPLSADLEGPPPIGRPYRNVRVHLLDERGGLVPTGSVGELHVAGAGVSLGYLGQDSLTRERFLPDTFGPAGSRMYRTGDLARWDSEGRLVFVGRTDDQVKVRGFRIELGEVENAVSRCAGVAAAAATVHEDAAGDRRLVAYAVPDGGAVLTPEAIRADVGERVPGHLVPSQVVIVDALPWTPNGKLDREALPAPAEQAPAGEEPRTTAEEIVAGLFAQTLGVPEVGVDKSFLDLGGHSLSATRLLGRIRKLLGTNVPVSDFFDEPTVSGVVRRLGERPERRYDGQCLVPLRASGTRSPLVCVHPAGGDSWIYLRLAGHLPSALPLYGLQPPDRSAARPPVEEAAEQYLTALRARRPEGPYRLLGHGYGALVAHAMAVRLRAEDHQVELLALMDAAPSLEPEHEPGVFDGDALLFLPEPAHSEKTAGDDVWSRYVSGRLTAHRIAGARSADMFTSTTLAAVASHLAGPLATPR